MLMLLPQVYINDPTLFNAHCSFHNNNVLDTNSFMFISSNTTKSMELSLQRTSSIEREPRTLSISQIQSARELAMYIFNTRTIEEASRIFTEGLQPVVSATCCMKSATTMEMDLGEEEEELNSRDATTQVAPPAAFRDIASAPF